MKNSKNAFREYARTLPELFTPLDVKRYGQMIERRYRHARTVIEAWIMCVAHDLEMIRIQHKTINRLNIVDTIDITYIVSKVHEC